MEVAPDFAEVFLSGVFEAAARLERFPQSGRIVPEIGDETMREVIYHQYRIIYVVLDDTVEILTLFSASRQFGSLNSPD